MPESFALAGSDPAVAGFAALVTILALAALVLLALVEWMVAG